jgi:hypothetical protein
MAMMKTGGESQLVLGGRRATTLCCAGVAMALGVGCNSLDAQIPEPTGSHLVIPTDTRAPVRATKAPVPISGGTLLVTRSGLMAVASDPDRDAIVVADLTNSTLRGRIALNPGDEPGRLVEDADGRVHVALRRGGAVVTIDPTNLAVVDRRAVCAAPRGLAVSATGMLDVACADGKLVTLPVAGGAITRSLLLDADLRDVIETPTGLTVTRFKSAEVLRVDANGVVTRRDHLPKVSGFRQIPDPNADPRTQNDPSFGAQLIQVEQPFKPLVAWRSFAGPNGSTVIIHQRAVDAEVEITPPSMNGGAYGGGGSSCSGISQDAVSVIAADGSVSNVTFAGMPLPVDAALLSNGTLVVVQAGPPDQRTPTSFVQFEGDDGSGGDVAGGGPIQAFTGGTVGVLSLELSPSGGPPAEGAVVSGTSSCQFSNSGLAVTDPAVAVAAIPNSPTKVIVQTVQPSTLQVIDVNGGAPVATISFDDGTTLDTGFQLFQRASAAGIACASCHPEGSEDGNVWNFKDVGPRRTQSLNVGLEGTAPFHWDGKLAGVASVMDEVFVGRMGGIHESESRLAVFQNWLFGLKAPLPMRAADDPAVVRGSAVFASAGCKSCHSGAHLTNNQSLDVGTRSAVPLQVPSLIGVGYRAPFLHDGCAATLLDRFNPACGGGDLHGATSQLGAADLGDLVSYLQSL